MDKIQFDQLLQQNTFNAQEVQQIELWCTQYPWFALLNMLYLRALKQVDNSKYSCKLSAVSTLVSNRFQLITYINKEFTDPLTRTTASAVNPVAVTKAIDDSVLLGFSTEYFSIAQFADQDAKTEAENPSDLLLIDQFIRNKPRIVPKMLPDSAASVKNKIPEVADEEVVSEILASIYIQQGHIELACRCFTKLSTMYPDRATYFLEQIKILKNQQ